MHLLYADESGHPADPNTQWFVLAGVSIFERQGFWFSRELDAIAERFNAAEPSSVELHGAEMRNGKGWRGYEPALRVNAIVDALSVLADSHRGNRIFAVVVEKGAVDGDPVEYAFEQLASRFDQYLQRLHLNGDTQRGLILFDKAAVERRLQTLATDFRTVGHRWGVLRNLVEVPVFVDSKASRLIQLADLIAYAIFRKYNRTTIRSSVSSGIALTKTARFVTDSMSSGPVPGKRSAVWGVRLFCTAEGAGQRTMLVEGTVEREGRDAEVHEAALPPIARTWYSGRGLNPRSPP